MNAPGWFQNTAALLKVRPAEFRLELASGALLAVAGVSAFLLRYDRYAIFAFFLICSLAALISRHYWSLRTLRLGFPGVEVELSFDSVRSNLLAAQQRGEIDAREVKAALQSFGEKFGTLIKAVIRRDGNLYVRVDNRNWNLGTLHVWERPESAQIIRLAEAIGNAPRPPVVPRTSAPTIHRPSVVVDSGIYGVVDEHGTYLNHDAVCVEGSPFPPLSDPRARGYVLRHKTHHNDESAPLLRPGQKVRYAGIYDVVDNQRQPLGRQVTCKAGNRFPPTHGIPHAAGYVLADRASHMARIYRPEDPVPESGSYDEVDREGISIGHLVKLDFGATFPSVTSAGGYGYMRH